MTPGLAAETSRLSSVKLKTGIWYGERLIDVDFPPNWQVEAYWPDTPAPLTEAEIEARMDDPVGRPTITDQARGKRSVAIIVDDLSRPTPAYRVLPYLLARLADAGIPAGSVSIVVATGTHGHQDAEGLRNKLGDEAWSSCRIDVHDDLKQVKHIGKTSYDTPVFVSRVVLDADLVIGVGGVYPQHTTGFGGGGKLALGVCGRQTIMELHYKHRSMEGRYNTDNDFRKDVCEVARMIRLDSILTLHIDAFSNVVNVQYGDHFEYYDSAAAFSKRFYTAPIAADADVVIANAYPLDTSLTFMRKGYKPLYTAPRSAVKIMIGAAHEGIGVHGLFQHINPSRLTRLRNLYLRAMSMNKWELTKKIFARITGVFATQAQDEADSDLEGPSTVLPPNTDHLYVWRTDERGHPIPEIEGLTVRTDWQELIRTVQERHPATRGEVRAVLYPCAPIQCQDDE